MTALPAGSVVHAADTVGNYTENLVIGMQAGGHPWRLDKTYNEPNNTMMEWVPQGETGQNWSEMITSITFKNHPEANTANMIAGIVRNFRSICAKVDILDSSSKVETDELRKHEGLPASYQTVSVLLRCDDPKPSPNPAVTVKKHEVLWLKGIQGWLTAYLVQRAWHSNEVSPDSILASDKTRNEWREWGDRVQISGIPDEKLPRKAPN